MPLVDTPWAIAVFSSREDIPLLLRTVLACRAACGACQATIDVLNNGNLTLAQGLGKALEEISPSERQGPGIRVWDLPLADKANAWNTYVHKIWPGATVTFFVDGYIEVMKDSFAKLAVALEKDLHAAATTGIDVQGRSARRHARFQTEISGIHGNLYCLRREAVLRVRESDFRLPLGIYRTDPTLESCLKFDFDSSANVWNKNRVTVQKDVTWRRPVLSLWNMAHWNIHWRRMIRQAQGDVEQEAIKRFLVIDKKPLRELPLTAADLLGEFITRHPGRWWRMVLANPLRFLAIKTACRQRDWTKADEPPRLISKV